MHCACRACGGVGPSLQAAIQVTVVQANLVWDKHATLLLQNANAYRAVTSRNGNWLTKQLLAQPAQTTYRCLPVFDGVLALLCPVDLAVSLVCLVVCIALFTLSHQASVSGFAAKESNTVSISATSSAVARIKDDSPETIVKQSNNAYSCISSLRAGKRKKSQQAFYLPSLLILEAVSHLLKLVHASSVFCL